MNKASDLIKQRGFELLALKMWEFFNIFFLDLFLFYSNILFNIFEYINNNTYNLVYKYINFDVKKTYLFNQVTKNKQIFVTNWIKTYLSRRNIYILIIKIITYNQNYFQILFFIMHGKA